MEFSITTQGLQSIQMQLTQFQRSTLPRAASNAMRETVFQARNDARDSATRKLDRPRPQTIKAIRHRWPSPQRIKQGDMEAAVFVQSFLVGQLLPNVIGGDEGRVPKGSTGVLEPTRHSRLNYRGNIPGLRQGSVSRRSRNTARFVNVPLGNTNPRTRHLSAGLYQRIGRGRNKRLRKVVTYQERRTITRPVWAEYPSIVLDSYQRNYAREFQQALRRELVRSRGR